MNTEKIRELSNIYSNFMELRSICRKLHKQDENACNYGLTERQEKFVEKLENRAEEIAKTMGLHFYHQSDPRGGTGYLIDDTMNGSNYNYGVFID